MKKAGFLILLSGLTIMPSLVMAHDYPTSERVQYALDCMTANQQLNVYESVNKCSCVIDEIAKEFSFRDYEDATTTYRLRNMAADRGGVFRDDEDGNSDIGKFEKIQIDAYKTCKLAK